MKKIRTFSAILAVMLLLVIFTTTAYALTVPNFTWQQSVSVKILSDTERGTDTGRLIYDGVATSPNDGTFQIKLEKSTGWFWQWTQVGTIRTVEQNSDRMYHLREKVYVNGEYFRESWHNLDTNGTYRIVLQNPTNPQATVFSRSRFDVQ